MNQISLALALVSSIALVACGGSPAGQGGTTTASHEGCACDHASHEGCEGCAHHEGEATTTASVVAPGEASVGDTTTCPVSGETFVVSESSPHAEYEGRTYYFCCAGCDTRFAADPAHYAHPAASGAATPSS